MFGRFAKFFRKKLSEADGDPWFMVFVSWITILGFFVTAHVIYYLILAVLGY